jgi:DNA-binding HxlR family transcriptional regulator
MVDVIDGKWKPIIINYLKSGTLRFGQLRRRMPSATKKVLVEQLRELEVDGIVHRSITGRQPMPVEYSLTAYGKTIVPILTLMAAWGEHHRKFRRQGLQIPQTVGEKPTIAAPNRS